MRHIPSLARLFRSALTACALFAAPLAAAAQEAAITGVVVPVGASAAPERAALHLQLLDVTEPDGAARLLSEITFNPVSLIDIPFTLPYDPAQISPDRVYAVYGRLIRDEKTIYVSKSDAHVLTGGAPDHVRITMTAVGAPAATGSALENGVWVLRKYADRAGDPASTIRFYSDGSAGGDTACNSWRGEAKTDGAALRFGPIMQTRKGCPGPEMEAERAFLSALPSVRSYAIEGDALILSDGKGAMVMELDRTR